MDFEYLLFLQNLRAEAPNFINSLLLFISEFAAGALPVVIIVVFLIVCCAGASGGVGISRC